MNPSTSTINGSISHNGLSSGTAQPTIPSAEKVNEPDSLPKSKLNTDLTVPTTEFPSQISVLRPPHPLTTRYSRQLLLPQLNGLAGQTRLTQARVLLIGLGGLGCPAALYLAAAGVGTLGFVDGDVVEKSNLHRQVLHTESRVGSAKVESAREGVRQVNSGCRVVLWNRRVVGARDVLGILEGQTPPDADDMNGIERKADEMESNWDLILDCTDNPATRYAINDAAVLAGVPIVSGAAQRGEGMLMVLNFRWREQAHQDVHTTTLSSTPSTASAATATNTTIPTHQHHTKTFPDPPTAEGRGPCYRCIFPHPPDPSTVHSCSEIGVLGTAVGTIGVLMAQEALKLLVQERGGVAILKPGDEAGKRGQMLIFNAFSAQGFKGMWRGVGLRGRRENCVSCGDGDGEKKITRKVVEEGKMDYEAFCGRVEDVRVLSREKGERVAAAAFLGDLARRGSHQCAHREDEKAGKEADSMKVVDVREEIEVELGATLDGAVNVPFSKIQRDAEGAFETVKWIGDGKEGRDEHEKVYFVCHRGNDSQIAAKRLMELDEKRGRNRAWVGDVEGGFVAMEKAQLSGNGH